MAHLVYIIASIIALACCILLVQGYRRSGRRLLMWSGICFAFLALENLLLFVDLVIVPGIDLRIVRGMSSLIGMGALVFGLIWERD